MLLAPFTNLDCINIAGSRRNELWIGILGMFFLLSLFKAEAINTKSPTVPKICTKVADLASSNKRSKWISDSILSHMLIKKTLNVEGQFDVDNKLQIDEALCRNHHQYMFKEKAYWRVTQIRGSHQFCDIDSVTAL